MMGAGSRGTGASRQVTVRLSVSSTSGAALQDVRLNVSAPPGCQVAEVGGSVEGSPAVQSAAMWQAVHDPPALTLTPLTPWPAHRTASCCPTWTLSPPQCP
jgi:hypothetical protein